MNQSELRGLIARMEEQVTLASAASHSDGSKDETDALSGAWDSLKNHLAVGPAPDTRACPACTREVMRAATLCGYCWAKLADSHQPA